MSVFSSFSDFNELLSQNLPVKKAKEFSKYMLKYKGDLKNTDFKLGRKIYMEYLDWKKLTKQTENV